MLLSMMISKDKEYLLQLSLLDNEAAYLAGVAAARTTKTKQVGFVGGIEGTEKGFEAGVKSVVHLSRFK